MMDAPKEERMRSCLQKLMLAAALAFLGLTITYPAQYGKDSPQTGEKEAASTLTRLGVPLQRDTRGVVRWIEATSGEISDEAMRQLPALPKLEWLEIGGGNVTRSGIANLKNCPALRRLYLHDIDLGGDSLGWLADLKNLEALSLQRTKIDGTMLKSLKTSDIAVLNLSGNPITDEDLDQIASIKGLEVLALADTKVSGEGIAKLEGMPRLNELNLMNCAIHDTDLEHFLTMPNLRIVYAAGCSISDMGIQSVVARFPMLAIFR
jgi:Leucine-rich repeat (LRR) protein